jgi:type I restriction enzyme R subunit
MMQYDVVAENPESTVVAEYHKENKREQNYQSETELESAFIEQLQAQAYEYLTIKSEKDLIVNLRQQLSKLNNYKFSDSEWKRFFKQYLANSNEGITEKTETIQKSPVKNLTRDNGLTKNIRLLDMLNIHNNTLQVINQYSLGDSDSSIRKNRYDVTILVNGLPLVHIELKRRGVDLKEAFNQINRYQRESFWASSGLFDFVQIFVISNGTHTRYYSNTTRNQHIKEYGKIRVKNSKKTSNSYEFTSWWADANNRPIPDLMDFVKTFFAKHTLLNLLLKYCVFTSEKLLLVMRPYQIVAAECILWRIKVAHNYKTYGTIKAGGYIWHTTGSGKTLTSFKTAQLTCKLSYIDKVLFVVDRKDLDYQTMKEYDRFEEGAADATKTTAELKKKIQDSSSKIIVTTIQKLDKFIKSHKQHEIYNKHVVLIFDECHRSQFGDMHVAITKNFKNYYIFGFTGTPIFTVNANHSGNPNLKTTEQAFGDKLHTYTIVNAIADKNVLPFRIDYLRTMREQEDIEDESVWDIDRERALRAPKRISNIVKYIREHFDQKTKRNSLYMLDDRRLSGFNSIFATASIDTAKLYYKEFQKQQKETPSKQRLKVAIIFSYAVNEEIPNELGDENSEDTKDLPVSSRDFLEDAIQDYNVMFKTNFDTSADRFQNYYKDVSEKVKKREIDLLIVVNMFLTGFDATTLNTLWVDKNLRLHGLMQAYSRTNRVLNSIKTFGNIVCFRKLENATNESIALFGDKEACGIVLLKTFEDYYNGYKDKNKTVRGYVDLIAELQNKFPVEKPIIEEYEKKEFINLYGNILKVKNVLSSFDDFVNNEILTERDVQDYHSRYIDLYNEFRGKRKVDMENVNDDIVFEMELIKQVEINIDYILKLIQQYHKSHLQDKEIIVSINKAIDSSVELRNKKDLIEQFIASLTPTTNIDKDWSIFVDTSKIKELDQIIAEEQLNAEETKKFIQDSLRDGYVPETGTAIDELLPPLDPFAADGQRNIKKQTVIEKFKSFLDKFLGV